MDTDTLWAHVRQQRRSLGDVLEDLAPDEWERHSLCSGWRVRDVAGHVLASPTVGAKELVPLLVRGRLSYNRAIFLDGRRRGSAPVEEILAVLRSVESSRRKPPVITVVEPLLDVLVHTQDIVRPLGRSHPMPTEAALVALRRALHYGFFFGGPPVGKVRLVATDADWSRGKGPEVRAPVAELLMLATGRPADAALVQGEGSPLVTTKEATR